MQSKLETLEGLERQVHLTLSVQDIEKEVQSELKKVQRKVRIQGFRPGKAPLSMVEKSHGPGVRYDIINAKVGQAFDTAIKEHNLRVAGMPAIEPSTDHTEGQLNFIAKFEVFPEITLPDLSGIEFKRYTSQVQDSDVDNTLDILRRQRATYAPQDDRAAQKDDRITLDFVGTIDGVEFEGGKAEDFVFLLGNGQMLPEFETAVEGMKKGETKKFPLKFPDDYAGKEVAGKTAEFTITIKAVAEQQLPEVNAEFVKQLGQSDGDIEKFKSEVRSNIEREVKARIQNKTKVEVLDQFAGAAEVAIPKSLVDQEVQARVQAAREDMKMRGVPNAEKMAIPADLFKAESERRVKLGLLVAELIEKEKLTVKPEQVRAKIEEFAQNYEKPEEVVTYYMTNRERRAEIENLVLEQNVVDFILSKGKVSEESVPFKELMGSI